MSTPKPESLSQARTWQRVCQLAEQAGLCSRCGPQFAWGVQNGFSSINEPCAACAVVMIAWPVVRPNGWRSPAGKLSAPGSWPGSAPARRTPTPEEV